ncbi:MAG: hypothetical protein ABII01_05985 [Candidatus Woesearchaeota archaeon]
MLKKRFRIRLRKDKKGIIFTLDAIFALISTITLVVFILFYMSRVSMVPYNKQALNRISQDTLTMLEKDGTLRKAIETNSTSDIEDFINSLPTNLCLEITLKGSDKDITNKINRTSCETAKENVFERRAFVANNFATYYALIQFWYNASLPGGTI